MLCVHCSVINEGPLDPPNRQTKDLEVSDKKLKHQVFKLHGITKQPSQYVVKNHMSDTFSHIHVLLKHW
jgi:hypothetical protein